MSVAKNVYVGKRYIPKHCGDWDNSKNTEYESLSVVLWQGASFTSKQDVPKGIDITNSLYWVRSADYNAQLEIYRNNVSDYHNYVIEEITNVNEGFSNFENDVNTQLDTNSLLLNRNAILTVNNLMGYKGVACRGYSTGVFASSAYRTKLLNAIDKFGFDSVNVVPNFYQSSSVTNDAGYRNPITMVELTDFITYCKSLKLHIILTPHIESDTTPYEWRGTFTPSNISTWFANYKTMILQYAQVAEDTNCEVFSIGSEMKSLTNELYSSYWNDIINSVRAIYTGSITYGINCNAPNTDEYDTIGSFIDNVDVISIDNYLDASTGFYFTNTKENINALMYRLYERFKYKPIIFAEWQLNANEKNVDTADLKIKNYNAMPFIRGMFTWVLDIDGGDNGLDNYPTDVIAVYKKYHSSKYKPTQDISYKINNLEEQNYYDGVGGKYIKIGELNLKTSYTGNNALFRITDCYNPNGHTFIDFLVSSQIQAMSGTPSIKCETVSRNGMETSIYAILTQNEATNKKIEVYAKTNIYGLYKHSLLYAENTQSVVLAPRGNLLTELPSGTQYQCVENLINRLDYNIIGGDNLVKNGDFRDGTIGEWVVTASGNYNESGCKITIGDSTYAIDTLKNARVQVQNNDVGGIATTTCKYTNIKALANNKYVLTFDIANEETVGNRAVATAIINYLDESSNILSNTTYSIPSSNTAWQKNIIRFTTPINCVNIQIEITAQVPATYAYAVGYLNICNIMLQKGNIHTSYRHTI